MSHLQDSSFPNCFLFFNKIKIFGYFLRRKLYFFVANFFNIFLYFSLIFYVSYY
ncbi:hypothetical protein HMPREF3189_00376 [Clostridiales bacterium KA00134]|nr:hypothetical protein HMPREF3189_00376 [Clostridiales bacterium KA00134]